jgi:hypothetical protein
MSLYLLLYLRDQIHLCRFRHVELLTKINYGLLWIFNIENFKLLHHRLHLDIYGKLWPDLIHYGQLSGFSSLCLFFTEKICYFIV